MGIGQLTSIKTIDPENCDPARFGKNLADCVVLTQDGKILMQQRPENWGRHAGVLNIFGGHVEEGETIIDALMRELHEELGARVDPADVVLVGVVTEEETGHTEAVHVHFWHDRQGTITGCYEGEARSYDSVHDALAHPKIMDYARWALTECQSRGLIPKPKNPGANPKPGP